MSYQSLIDDAISRARVKVASGLPQPTDKLASAHNSGALLGEAEKIANALEYMAMATADDGSAAGAARAEMVRDFFKTAAEADKKKGIMQPLVTETMTSGTQKVAPQTGKAKLNPKGLVFGDSPKQTTAPDGMMSRNAMEQTPSSSPTKAASLYDMLMGARMAKIAAESGAGAPRQMDSSQPPPGYQKGQEGGHAQGPLSTSERIVAAKRRELHAPSRNRLSELFAHSGDTAQSVASAAGTFPLAAAKGGMKVASLAAARQKSAGASVVALAAAIQQEGAGSPIDFLGGKLAAAVGAGIGAAMARDGEGGEGAVRGGLGDLGGSIAGGLAGGLGGALVSGGHRGSTMLGAVGGALYGQHKGIRYSTKHLAKQRGMSEDEHRSAVLRGQIGGTIGSAIVPYAGGAVGGYYGAESALKKHKKHSEKKGSVAEGIGNALRGEHGNKILAAGLVGTGYLTLKGRQHLKDSQSGQRDRILREAQVGMG